MTIPELKIRCRLEEVTVIGKFLTDAALAELVAFMDFSTIFTPVYFTNVTTKMTAIEALMNPKQLTAELKVITQRVYGNMTELRTKIDSIEFYIIKAVGLTINAKDFGVKEVRAANNRGDVEALIGALNFLLTNATNNQAALAAKGYTPAKHSELTALRTNLINDNAAQNAKINERNNKVIANYGLINEYWAYCVEISDAGKRIFKRTATNKVDDFTIAELKRRIRQEQKKNKFTGKITASETEPPSGDMTGIARIAFGGVRVEMIPVTGGRRRVTKSDAKGLFEIKSLTEGEYIAIFTNAEADSKNCDVVIETGKTTTVNINMVAKAGSELAKIVKKTGTVS